MSPDLVTCEERAFGPLKLLGADDLEPGHFHIIYVILLYRIFLTWYFFDLGVSKNRIIPG